MRKSPPSPSLCCECDWRSRRVNVVAFINARASHQDHAWSWPSPNIWPHTGCSPGLGWKMAHPAVRGPLCHTGMPVMQLARWHDQARINFRKLNGKEENAHIKKTNLSSSACLWTPAKVLIVVFINFPSCSMSSDNYHSQAIDTSLTASSWNRNRKLGLSEMQSPLARFPCLCKEKHCSFASNQQTKPSRVEGFYSGRGTC